MCCDQCDHWFHKTCVSMSSNEYKDVGDQSWRCIHCKTVNCSSFLYNGYNLNVTNSFDILASIPGDDSVFRPETSLKSVSSPFAPRAHSSPMRTSKNGSASNQNIKSSVGSSSTRYTDSTCEQKNPTEKQTNFRVLVSNANSVKGKQAEIAELLEYTDADVALFCETKLDASVNFSEFLPKNYSGHLRKDRTYWGGGVLIALKTHYVVDEVELVNIDCEVVWAKIALTGSPPLYIASFYRPEHKPGESNIASLEALEKSLDLIAALTKNNTKSTILIGGDFNADGIDWDAGLVKSDCEKVGVCNKVIEIFDKFHLTQLQKSPTRGNAILDLFATNKPGLVKSIKNIPGIADHDTLVIDSDIKAQTTKKSPRKIYLWKDADWDGIRQDVKTFGQIYLQECDTRKIEENYSHIENHLKSVMNNEKLLPRKMTRTRMDLPWFSSELKRMCKRKRRLFNRAKKTGHPQHKKLYSEAQKSTQSALKKARWQYLNNILQTSLEERNNKPFWSYIRSQQQDNLGVSPLKEGGQLHSDKAKRCELLAKQFKSAFTKDKEDPYQDTKLHGPAYPPIKELEIGEEGVRRLLEAIDPSKAAGPDELPCRLLKELATELAPIFTSLFRQTLHTGQLPTPWTTAWVVPIFKSGARCEPANYRPVSLTCVMCKLFEHIVCSHIRRHMDEHGILTDYNHGFRSQHSCESQLLITTTDIFSRMDRKEQIDMAVLDFSKAFDTVPHRRLLSKLRLCGIHGNLLQWIKSFLSTRTQSVIIEGHR